VVGAIQRRAERNNKRILKKGPGRMLGIIKGMGRSRTIHSQHKGWLVIYQTPANNSYIQLQYQLDIRTRRVIE